MEIPSAERKGKVQTVLGCVDSKCLGKTLTHEHLSIEIENPFFVPMPECQEKYNMPYEMKNINWINQHPYSYKPNLHMWEAQDAVKEEVHLFKENGGGCIVENTCNGISRDAKYYKTVAKETGVQIVCGAGYYVAPVHPADMSTRKEEQLCLDIMSEITDGCDGTDIKCGIIGEIGCTWPLHVNERKVLRAAAMAQSTLGAPLMIHPGRHKDAPFEILRILQEAGVSTDKTVMGHLDRTILENEDILEYASLGSYCEYDLFGIETSFYTLCKTTPMPSDAQRIQRIQLLIQEGYGDKITIAHDIHTKHRMLKFGGHGFSHILVTVIPQMKAYGMTDEQINKILINNPADWLTFTK